LHGTCPARLTENARPENEDKKDEMTGFEEARPILLGWKIMERKLRRMEDQKLKYR